MPNIPWAYRTIFQLNVVGMAFGAQVVNTFAFEASTVREATFSSDSVAQAASGELADDWITNIKTTWLACHPSDYRIDMVTCQVLERPGTWRHKLTPIERPQATANVGTVGTPAEEAYSAVVVRWRTPQAGKRHRGRTYVGPLPQSWITDGRLASAGVTAYTAWANAQNGRWGEGGSDAADFRQTIYSRPYNSGEYQYTSRKTGSLTVVTPPDYGGNSTNVTSFSLDNILRTQRRRQIGVGA